MGRSWKLTCNVWRAGQVIVVTAGVVLVVSSPSRSFVLSDGRGNPICRWSGIPWMSCREACVHTGARHGTVHYSRMLRRTQTAARIVRFVWCCDKKIHITLPTIWTSMRKHRKKTLLRDQSFKKSDAKRAFDITFHGQRVLSEQASCEKILHESIIDPQKIEESGTDFKSKCALEDCSERSGKRGCHLWCGWISWPHDERWASDDGHSWESGCSAHQWHALQFEMYYNLELRTFKSSGCGTTNFLRDARRREAEQVWRHLIPICLISHPSPVRSSQLLLQLCWSSQLLSDCLLVSRQWHNFFPCIGILRWASDSNHIFGRNPWCGRSRKISLAPLPKPVGVRWIV